MGREERCSVKSKHLLAVLLHSCCAHKTDPMEGGKERMPLTAVYTKMFKAQKSRGVSLRKNVAGLFFLQMSLVLVKGL